MVSSYKITPLIDSLSPSVVNRICRYARRRCSVDSSPMPASRLAIVGVLSSAARMPFPGATSASAVWIMDLNSTAHLLCVGFFSLCLGAGLASRDISPEPLGLGPRSNNPSVTGGSKGPSSVTLDPGMIGGCRRWTG